MKCFDLQLNGAFGIDFSNADLTAEQFIRTCDALFRAGITRFLPTLITLPLDVYRRNAQIMLDCIDKHGLQYEIPGFHFEGPFLSAKPGAIGAHNPSWVQPADEQILRSLFDAADRRIRILTVAADTDNINPLIHAATDLGIVVSLGHHLANQDQIDSAAEAGATLLTHLGNGIPNAIDRHHNPIWAGLANDRLTALTITDGHHLPKDVLKCFFRCKGVDRMIIISDSSSAAGLPPGKYNVLGNADAVLHENGLLYNPVKKCLVGSGCLMPQCIEHFRSLGLTDEAGIEKMCWTNPHRILGLPCNCCGATDTPSRGKESAV